jgi:hypothetical protein
MFISVFKINIQYTGYDILQRTFRLAILREWLNGKGETFYIQFISLDSLEGYRLDSLEGYL